MSTEHPASIEPTTSTTSTTSTIATPTGPQTRGRTDPWASADEPTMVRQGAPLTFDPTSSHRLPNGIDEENQAMLGGRQPPTE